MRWYYETGFRRYVRGLEKIRVKGVEKSEVIGVVSQGVDGLCEFCVAGCQEALS